LDKATQIFVVTLSKHRIFGLLLYPYFAEQCPGEPFLRLLRRIRLRDVSDPTIYLTAEEAKIVKTSERYSDEVLVRKFCPDKAISDLQLLFGKEDIRQKVLSHVELAVFEILELLKSRSFPVYQKREKYTNIYEEDLITLRFRNTGAVFNFHKSEEGTQYFLTLRDGDEHISLLHRNVEILVNEPCRIYYMHKIYFFDEISASKLIPSKRKSIFPFRKRWKIVISNHSFFMPSNVTK